MWGTRSATYCERLVIQRNRSRSGPVVVFGTIDVQVHICAVVGRDDVGPCIRRNIPGRSQASNGCAIVGSEVNRVICGAAKLQLVGILLASAFGLGDNLAVLDLRAGVVDPCG